MTNAIGISAHLHDAACCLRQESKLVAAPEEERFHPPKARAGDPEARMQILPASRPNPHSGHRCGSPSTSSRQGSCGPALGRSRPGNAATGRPRSRQRKRPDFWVLYYIIRSTGAKLSSCRNALPTSIQSNRSSPSSSTCCERPPLERSRPFAPQLARSSAPIRLQNAPTTSGTQAIKPKLIVL
jgi:hypothetical protein